MKSFVPSLSHVLVAIAATTAFAGASAADATSRVEVITNRADLAAAQAVLAARTFETAYEMSTGRRMTVSALGEDSVRVRYGRRALTSLRHDGQGSFLSQDGQLALRFELDDGGEPNRVRFVMPTDWQ